VNTETRPDGAGPLATDPGVRLPPDILSRLDLEALFPGLDGVEVELGSGDGSFLAEYAAQNPGRGFLGVERLLGRLRKLERKAQRRGLCNLRVLRLEAAYVLRWKLASGTVSALHVYFPDPWPKRRHWKRRLVNEPFVEEAARILKPGGRVFLRTDNEPYFEQMREVFGRSDRFVEVEFPAGLAGVVTDFEREFNARGIPTRRVAYELSDGAGLANRTGGEPS
jgi:tRNA (guanine-N7-)-methyltransferase